MTAGFNVDTAELDTQAEAITGVVEGIRQARSASDEEGVGGLVYGILFDPTILPILSSAKDTYAQAITNCADIGDAIVNGLKSNIATYKAVEDDVTKALQKLREG
jgi:hypothetical protein